MKDETKKSAHLQEQEAAELEAILKRGTVQDELEDQPRIEMQREQTFDHIAPTLDPQTLRDPQEAILKEVELTDEEKEVFLEAVLMDKTFELKIDVFGDKVINVRSRNAYEQALVYQCAMEMLERAPFKDKKNVDVLLWIQKCTVALAVTEVFGKSVPYLEFSSSDNEVLDEDKARLLEFVGKHYGSIAYPKWQVLLSALLLFTQKEKLLLENVANRDFWSHVG